MEEETITTGAEEIKTYTEEEVQAMLQKETDRKTTKALETAKSKWEAEYQAKLETEKSEAEKLAKMSEAERFNAELAKQKESFESERAQFNREKLELQTVKELAAEGLPTRFSSYVLADTADAIKDNIKNFKSEWQAEIEKAVDERLQGRTPKTANKPNGDTVTHEQFSKMGYTERLSLYNTNPDLYEQLKK
jgi:hypothetical protein